MDCRGIVNGALRKLGRLGAGREPRQADASDALAALQGLYGAWIAAGAFGRMSDVIPTADYVARENERIYRTDLTIEITLPGFVAAYTQPRRYADERVSYEQVDGNARPPRDGAVVQIVDVTSGATESFIYAGTLRAWQSIDALTLNEEAPRSAEDPEGLSAVLATEIADQFGADIQPTTARRAALFQSNLIGRWSTPRRAAVAEYF